jgi:hypothetical protein
MRVKRRAALVRAREVVRHARASIEVRLAPSFVQTVDASARRSLEAHALRGRTTGGRVAIALRAFSAHTCCALARNDAVTHA